MGRDQIKENTVKIFSQVFKSVNDFPDHISVDDIEEWDSLNHMVLIGKLEEEFSIQFDLFKLIELRSMADFVNYIESEIGEGN